MALPRKLWSALKPATQKRKLTFYRKRGLSDAQVKAKYNAGTLGSQKAVRGHAQTPERPSQAARHPEKFEKYITKHRPKRGGPILSSRDRAYSSIFGKLGGYEKYNDDSVRRHVYNMMSDAEIEYAINASEDMLVGRAAANYGIRLFRGFAQSPWWYH